MLCWITVLGEHERVERDLKARTEALLQRNNLGWAKVAFAGRDAVLSGQALDEGDPNKAFEVTRSMWGVRYVANQAALIEKADAYQWSAQVRDKAIRLAGFYPNETSRKAIIGAAQATFPNYEIDATRMKAARGVPNQDQWLGGISFSLKQLARLKSGGRVELDGLAMSVEGEAEDTGGYRAVKSALASGLPQGTRLKLDKVTPPVAKPYVWGAKDAGNQLQLTGFVPSERTRGEVLAAARRAYPRSNVVDRMEIAAGEPKDFAQAALGALARIGEMEEGAAELRDGQLTVSGLAADEARAEAVRRALKGAVPASVRATDRIRIKEQAPRPISPYVTGVSATPQAVVLTGHVPSEADRAALVEAVRQRLPGRRIDDRMTVGVGAAPPWRECTLAGITGLGRLGTGTMELTDRRLALVSETSDAALAGTVTGNVRAGAAPACEPDVRIALLQPPPPPPPQPQRNEAAEAEARRKAAAEAAEAEARRKAAAEAAEAEARRKAAAEAAEAEARRKAEEERQKAAAAAAALVEQRRAEGQRCQQQLQTTAQDGLIRFARASADIERVSHPTLDRLATVAKSCPSFVIEVEGHTDAEGTPERNKRLSDRRAASVVDYLVRSGVASSQLVAIGYGQDRPVAPNETAEGRARNRRIDFTVKTQ